MKSRLHEFGNKWRRHFFGVSFYGKGLEKNAQRKLWWQLLAFCRAGVTHDLQIPKMLCEVPGYVVHCGLEPVPQDSPALRPAKRQCIERGLILDVRHRPAPNGTIQRFNHVGIRFEQSNKYRTTILSNRGRRPEAHYRVRTEP